jgi:hypothetical protein
MLKYPNISELIIANETRILSFSDIHGDIHSLIIALRDCGEVIKKQSFNNDKEDAELENLLNIDISIEDNGYIDTLNYKWVGGNTHIVIIGDFLDINRDDSFNKNSLGQNEYPQIEIKIFRFINSINKQAKENGGRIIKMFGNHEINNIIGNKDFIEKYSFPNTMQLQNYYRNNNRVECFMRGNEGYNLMLEDGMYILFKINNNLFVHGGPANNLNFDEYNRMNYIINFKENTNIDKVISFLAYAESPLWIRDFGEYSLVNNRINNNEEFCNQVKRILTMIKGNNYFNDDIKTIRIIIGHCVQSTSTISNNNNITFSYINKTKSNNIKEVLEPKLEEVIENNNNRFFPKKLTLIDEYKNDYLKINNDNNNNNDNIYDVKYRGKVDLKKRIVFGITMECDNDLNSADNYIYKVDVGSSRGFDYYYLPKKNDISNLNLSLEELENKYFLSRTPQILEIINNKPRIIRSLVNNTIIHQPRRYYKEHFKTNRKIKKLKKLTIFDLIIHCLKKIFLL